MKLVSDLPTFRTLHVSHAVLTVVVLAGIGYQLYLTARLEAVHEPLLRAVAAIALHSTDAHLACDEVLAGDHRDEQSVWIHLDAAEGYARVVLQGGVYRELTVQRLTAPDVRRKVEQASHRLAELRTLLDLRMATVKGGRTDRDRELQINDAVHQAFSATLTAVSSAEVHLREIMTNDRRSLIHTQTCFLISWLLLAMGGTWVLHLLERRNLQAFAAIRKAEAEMRRLVRGVESTVEGIVMTDTRGEIFYVNPAFTAMTGYEPHEAIGQNPRLLKSGIHPTSFYRDLWGTILHGDVWVGEITNRRKDGSLYDAAVTIAPVEDQDGLREGFVAIHADITERKRTEEALRHLTEVLQDQADELRRSNEELEQFAYVASHDLQEPLRMVTSFTQLLERRYSDRLDDDGREFIAYAVDGTRRMQALIHALLDYSRVGSRGTPCAPVGMQQVLDGVLADLRAAIDESAATITAAPLPVVQGDPIQLGQLLQNLISNALKFRGERPLEVRLSAERNGDEWHFAVHDNGIGIDPHYADRIFVIFQRLHTRERYDGTGIGLAVCKKIVQYHGGRIWVESQPGEGATFHFTLRAAPAVESESSALALAGATADDEPPLPPAG